MPISARTYKTFSMLNAENKQHSVPNVETQDELPQAEETNPIEEFENHLAEQEPQEQEPQEQEPQERSPPKVTFNLPKTKTKQSSSWSGIVYLFLFLFIIVVAVGAAYYSGMFSIVDEASLIPRRAVDFASRSASD